ncbi:MAG: hypothetical protein IPK16_19270 [Anaerolineales bacterium]|nr:hypothetical protein [Anaerolineales bacterium]
MLFMAPDASKLERVQGTFLSDDEINKLVRYWKGIRAYDAGQPDLSSPSYPQVPGLDPDDDLMRTPFASPSLPVSGTPAYSPLSQPPLFEQIEQMKAADARDEFFDEAVKIVQENGRGSVSLLQRRLRIGYGRAARLVDQLEAAGILGPDLGASRGRDYLAAAKDSPETETTAKSSRAGTDSDDPNDAPPPRIWM